VSGGLLQKNIRDITLVVQIEIAEIKRVLWVGGAALVLVFAAAYYFLMPVAEVAAVRRGTAISAVYGTVRIEPAFVVRVRAQTTALSNWRNLLRRTRRDRQERGKESGARDDRGRGNGATAETSAHDLQAAVDRAALPLPSAELLKAAEDNLQRLERVVGSGNVPAVEYQKAKAKQTGCAAQWRRSGSSGTAISIRLSKQRKNWKPR